MAAVDSLERHISILRQMRSDLAYATPFAGKCRALDFAIAALTRPPGGSERLRELARQLREMALAGHSADEAECDRLGLNYGTVVPGLSGDVYDLLEAAATALASPQGAEQRQEGLDYSDGCDLEGFVGGCARMGCHPAPPGVQAAQVSGVDAERHEDMSTTGRLRLHAQEDGDMCVLVIEESGASAGVEFCASGGRSPRTLQALRDLSRAMKADGSAAHGGEDAR